MHVGWTIDDVVDRALALEATGPLPSRTVLVPHARMAHALRRALIEREAKAVAGIELLTPLRLAERLLRFAGVEFTTGEEELRAARLRLLFRTITGLQHFSTALFAATRGWPEAFALTIAELEASDVTVAALRRVGDARADDLALVWDAVDNEAANSWSMPRVIREAANRITTKEVTVPSDSILAVATLGTSTAQARLFEALGAETVLLAARPTQPARHRIATTFGPRVADDFAKSHPPRPSDTERDLLTSYLFEPIEVLTAPGRPTAGSDRDDTVRLEQHAGVEAEIGAAADWVVEQIVEHGTPLEEVAILVPVDDPWLSLVRHRIERLPGAPATHVAGGVPLVSEPAGARVFAVIRALRQFLSAAALADVLPLLRCTDEDAQRVSKGAALDLACSLGTVGGSPGHPKGALEWSDRATERLQSLEAQLALIANAERDAEQLGIARGKRDLERLVQHLKACAGGIAALVEVARTVVDDAPVGGVWSAIAGFCDAWLVLPPGPKPHVLLGRAMRPYAIDDSFGAICGVDALEFIEQAALQLRTPVGRYGDPAVYIGTLHSAAGLRFNATRVIGLCEGSVPAQPRQNPVLPDTLRQSIDPALPTCADRVVASLAALDQAVRGAGRHIALSAPHLGMERSYRQVSSAFLEAAAALGRDGQAVSSGIALRRDELHPSVEAASAFRRACPVTESSWYRRIAAGQREIPLAWSAPHLDVAHTGDTRAMDGLLSTAAQLTLAGLSAERPISASKLQTLLRCPHQFLYENVFYWREPARPRAQGELDSLAFGSLFHRVAEAFYGKHGSGFCQKDNSLEHWLELARVEAVGEFETFLTQYPLAGELVRQQQRARLLHQLDDLLVYEWAERPKRRFVATERPFGEAEPMTIALEAHDLWVRGYIDLIEVEDGTTVVRDLKTSQCKPRAGRTSAPSPVIDIQVGLYALVTGELTGTWHVPAPARAGYLHSNDRKGRERTFEPDDDLIGKTRAWLSTAAGLLSERAFPRTPNADDCTHCPYKPVCGPDAQDKAVASFQEAQGALADFAEMKS